MKFIEYAKHRWIDHVRTTGPAVVFFGAAPIFTSVEWWFFIVAPLSVLFLAGLMLVKQYNHWYQYYNPKTGLLRDRK